MLSDKLRQKEHSSRKNLSVVNGTADHGEERKKTKERKEMSDAKICPQCGARNEGLNLQETDGSYVCCECEAVIDTKKSGTENNREKEHEKQ